MPTMNAGASISNRTTAANSELPKLFMDEMLDPVQSGVVAGLNGIRPNWNQPKFYEWLAPEVSTEDIVVFGSDELTREGISFAPHPVVIEITDDQADQLMRFHSRGDPGR